MLSAEDKAIICNLRNEMYKLEAMLESSITDLGLEKEDNIYAVYTKHRAKDLIESYKRLLELIRLTKSM